jgi:hypothetical protein
MTDTPARPVGSNSYLVAIGSISILAIVAGAIMVFIPDALAINAVGGTLFQLGSIGGFIGLGAAAVIWQMQNRDTFVKTDS